MMNGEMLGDQYCATAQAARTESAAAQIAELEALGREIERCADALLDFNPVLNVMARSLHQAIELEVCARRLRTE